MGLRRFNIFVIAGAWKKVWANCCRINPFASDHVIEDGLLGLGYDFHMWIHCKHEGGVATYSHCPLVRRGSYCEVKLSDTGNVVSEGIRGQTNQQKKHKTQNSSQFRREQLRSVHMTGPRIRSHAVCPHVRRNDFPCPISFRNQYEIAKDSIRSICIGIHSYDLGYPMSSSMTKIMRIDHACSIMPIEYSPVSCPPLIIRISVLGPS